MRITLLPAATLALSLTVSPLGAQDWLSMETNRFTVVSQLNDRDTRRWAREFNRFVNAMQGLMAVNENLLPPLTVVLFRRDGAFSPYRIRTESGVATANTAVFLHHPTWSLIGMPGVRGASTDNSTIFHETVHWYMSADPSRLPLWFGEGIAEVFSTFDVEDGLAKWGRLIPNNIAFLKRTGFLPLEELFSGTQDQAMHTNARFYTQAWLFVHYLLVGRILDGGPSQMAALLEGLKTMDAADAFEQTFGMTFQEMDRELRDYAGRSRLDVVSSEIVETDDTAFVVQPASEAEVQLQLARLAFGTRNDEPLTRHLERLLELAPDSAEAYDLLASIEIEKGNDDIEPLLDKAIARGSRDARTYELKAAISGDAVRNNDPVFWRGAYDADEARRIANFAVSSANLQPLNLRIYTVLADALFSVSETRDYDRVVFENGALVYPNEGIMLIGQAALAFAAGETTEAERLVELSLADSYQLGERERVAAQALLRRFRRD